MVLLTSIRPLAGLAALLAVLGLAACESSGGTSSSLGATQPRSASYRCDDGVVLQVRNAGSRVSVEDSRGVMADLPASPPGVRDRYAEGPHSLVLNGREATWFVSGKKPLDCTR